jgi:hypothetical protein
MSAERRICIRGRSHDVVIELVVPEDLTQDARRGLPWGFHETPHESPSVRVRVVGTSAGLSVRFDDEVVWCGRRTDELVHQLRSHLELAVATHAPRRIFVHSGVVGDRSGRAILLPGRSFSGKSRLVNVLVRSGFRYYSDEYAVLDRAGFVHPWTRHLALRDDRQSKAMILYEGLDPVGLNPIPVGLVLSTSFVRGAAFRPRALTSGEVMVALLANTVAVRLRPADALEVVRRVAVTATGLGGDRGEAEDVVARLLARDGSGREPRTE